MENISIVVTTYNGEKYISELMRSLKNQSLLAEEVLFLDDNSKDRTTEIISKYIYDNNLSGWRLIKNDSNQGWKNNFYNGFIMARGEFIFPCDQDDIWNSNKLKIMVEVMKNNPDILLLTSNYHIFFSETDKGSSAYKHQNRKMKNDGSIKRIKINPKWSYILRPGCTFCFRKSFFNMIKAEWNTQYAHDAILWRYACVMEGLANINTSLIEFRRHGDNATSTSKWTKKNRIETFEQYIWFHETVLKYVKNEKDKQVINDGIEFLTKRIEFYTKKNILGWLFLFFKYPDYYLSLKGAILDLIYGLKSE